MRGNVDLPHLVRRAALQHPSRIAISDGDLRIDMRTALAQAERLANAFDGLGLKPGSPIAILSENRWEYVIADLAIMLGRHIRVALNSRLAQADHEAVLADSGASVLIHSGAFAAEAEALGQGRKLIAIGLNGPTFAGLLDRASDTAHVRPGDTEDPAWITYTAGTTGKPKGVVLSQRAIREVAFNLLLELGPVAPGSRIVLPQALSHGAGYFVLPWLLSGGGVHLLRRFDAEEVVAIGAARPGLVFKCVPAMLPPLIEAGGRGAGFASIVYGASPISRSVLEASLDCFGPVLTQIYGQSEAPATLTCLHPRDHMGPGEERFSAGRPWRTVAIEIRDGDGIRLGPGEAGEVAITGPHLMTGYHGLPELTAAVFQNGWINTRDRGFIDDRGFVHLRGRMDDMIVSGGQNISPREVEDVLCGFPAIAEASVLGMPDETWGSAVAAAVTLKPGASATCDSVIAFARPLLGFRTPKVVRIVDAIPRTAYGKVDRGGLAALFGGAR